VSSRGARIDLRHHLVGEVVLGRPVEHRALAAVVEHVGVALGGGHLLDRRHQHVVELLQELFLLVLQLAVELDDLLLVLGELLLELGLLLLAGVVGEQGGLLVELAFQLLELGLVGVDDLLAAVAEGLDPGLDVLAGLGLVEDLLGVDPGDRLAVGQGRRHGGQQEEQGAQGDGACKAVAHRRFPHSRSGDPRGGGAGDPRPRPRAARGRTGQGYMGRGPGSKRRLPSRASRRTCRW
jgi:hypothetical protein